MCIPALPPQSSLYYGDTIDLEDDETANGDAPVEKVFNIPVFKAQISKWLGKLSIPLQHPSVAVALFAIGVVFVSVASRQLQTALYLLKAYLGMDFRPSNHPLMRWTAPVFIFLLCFVDLRLLIVLCRVGRQVYIGAATLIYAQRKHQTPKLKTSANSKRITKFLPPIMNIATSLDSSSMNRHESSNDAEDDDVGVRQSSNTPLVSLVRGSEETNKSPPDTRSTKPRCHTRSESVNNLIPTTIDLSAKRPKRTPQKPRRYLPDGDI